MKKSEPLYLGIETEINFGGIVTHLVTISYDDIYEIQFKATIMPDDGVDKENHDNHPITLYEVKDGQKNHSTYIEAFEDSITICLNGKSEQASIIEFIGDEDSVDFAFECEDDEGNHIHIQCDYYLGEDDSDLANWVHTSFIDADGNPIDDEDDEDYDPDLDDYDLDDYEYYEDEDYIDETDPESVKAEIARLESILHDLEDEE